MGFFIINCLCWIPEKKMSDCKFNVIKVKVFYLQFDIRIKDVYFVKTLLILQVMNVLTSFWKLLFTFKYKYIFRNIDHLFAQLLLYVGCWVQSMTYVKRYTISYDFWDFPKLQKMSMTFLCQRYWPMEWSDSTLKK